MFGVEYGKVIHRGLQASLDEIGSNDKRFSVKHEIISKERSTCVRYKLKKFRDVEKEKMVDIACFGNTIGDRNFTGCVAVAT